MPPCSQAANIIYHWCTSSETHPAAAQSGSNYHPQEKDNTFMPEKNWYEELGQAVAVEFGLREGSSIEHQCGTVWVEQDGETYAISAMKTEEDA